MQVTVFNEFRDRFWFLRTSKDVQTFKGIYEQARGLQRFTAAAQKVDGSISWACRMQDFLITAWHK